MSESFFRRRWTRYGFAAAAVAAGFALRQALTARVGPGLATYVTFYPPVVVVALLGGFGPGLLATALAGLVVNIWVIAPIGHLSPASAAARVGLLLFLVNCLFICEVARRYRRKRDETAAYERDQALRESREALRRQAELIDPIRAELISQEMQRAVQERGKLEVDSAPSASWLPWVPSLAGVSVVTLGALVWLGWIFNVATLKNVLPGLANMKANTALCFVLTGLALIGHRSFVIGKRSVAGMLLAAGALVIAAMTLGEYITSRDFGIDQLLFLDEHDAHTVYPGRMVTATAIGFVLSSVSLLLLGARSRAGRWTQQAMAMGTAATGTFAILGYLYSVELMYDFAGPASMALHTSVGFLVMGAGLLFAQPDGWARVLGVGGPGAQMAKRFVPVALLLPVGLVWLHRYSDVTGRFEASLAAGLSALGMMMALLVAVWLTAQALNRADAARRETEMQLRNQAELIDQAGEALIVRELGGAICSWNQGAKQLYGWSAAEVVGQPIHTVLRTEPAAQVQAIEAALAQTGRWDGELVHTTRDGRQLTIDAHKTATRTTDGRVLVLESLRDISARKAAETALRTQAEALKRSQQAALNLARDATEARTRVEQAADALRESEARFRALVAASSDIVYRISPDWTTTRYLAGQDFVVDAKEPSGAWLKKYVHTEDHEFVSAAIDEAVRTKSLFELEHRIVRADGSLGWVFSRAVPILNQQGEIIEWFGTASNITERKQAEQERKQHEERLREAQKLESLGLLAGGVAHDFNNLLVGVIGNASLAAEMLSPDHPAAEPLQGVLKSGEQAAHLTRQMLAYSGKGKFFVEHLDLSTVIPEMVTLLRPSISKKIAVHLDFERALPPIEADRGQVQQVFMNLALNAAEAIGSHEGMITVRAGVCTVDNAFARANPEAESLQPGEHVFLEIHDTGCGMDETTKSKIFDPFFTTKFTGRGLGLAAVAGIVRGHKGVIVARSALGKGSTFTVLLPIASRPKEQAPAPASSLSLRGSGVVLVVDDEALVRGMAKKALERQGYTVLLADSGVEAIHLFKRHPGDLAVVLLDLSMPGMSGQETLPELRKIRPAAKVIISSGYSEAETMAVFQGQRVSGFIQKPYTPMALAEKVKLALV